MINEPARFNKRVIAYLIDLLISYGIGAWLSSYLYLKTSFPWYFSLFLTILICYLVYILINTPFMAISRGKTFGGLILGIKMVTKDNHNVSFRQIFIKNIYLGLLPFSIANAIYMLIVHTEITLFDKMTDTITIDTKDI